MNDTAIGLVFIAIATVLIGYGPFEIIAAQVGFLALEFIGRRLIDWYIARHTPFDRNKPY